jgi:N-acetylglucosamine-6-phosphate deacetylase
MIRLFGRLFAPDDRGLRLVTVEDGRVRAIEPAERPSGDSLGSPEMAILPGLIDVQVNGAFGFDFSDPAADMDLVSRGLPQFGVTSYVPTVVTSPLDAYGPVLANLRRAPKPGAARILGAHLEGPFLSPRYPGTHDPALLRNPSTDVTAGWLSAGDVRIVTVAPELPGSEAVIEYLAARGVVVSMGHSDASWEAARAGQAAGIRFGTHIFSAMRPLRHRDPGLVGYLLASHLPVGLIADGHHLAFETIALLARIKAPDELVLVTDALAGLGMPPGPFRIAGREYVSDGTCGRLPDGTLSGSLLPLHRALRNLVEAAGVDPAVAVQMATLNPARLLGLDSSIGRVEVGRGADLVLVDEHWTPVVTLVDGAIAWGPGSGREASPAGQEP